mgnify:CR=1 FL=1
MEELEKFLDFSGFENIVDIENNGGFDLYIVK